MSWIHHAKFFMTGLALALGLDGLGCGYTFQTSRNSYADDGYEKVYIQQPINLTTQPGVGGLVYNSILKALLGRGRWKVVGNESSADLILIGSVNAASFSVANLQQIKNLQTGLGRSFSVGTANIPDQSVAQSYSAVLSCSFTLKKIKRKEGENPILWSNSFSKGKQFPSANQLDVPGTTSPLINQSEFERALGDLAPMIALDAEESMFSRF